jgi:hypothetical protein
MSGFKEHYFYIDRPYRQGGPVDIEKLGFNQSQLFHVDSLKREISRERYGKHGLSVNFELIFKDFYAGIEALMAFRRMKDSRGGSILDLSEYEAIMMEVANACREYAPWQPDEEHEKQNPGMPHLFDAITFVIDHKSNYGFITVDPRLKYAAIQHENPNYEHNYINPAGHIGEWKYIEKGLRKKGPAAIRKWALGLLEDAFKYAETNRGRRLTKQEIISRAGNLAGFRGSYQPIRGRYTEELK